MSISTRTILYTSQLIDRSITNSKKLTDLPLENPLFGRSDKFVRDLFETKIEIYPPLVKIQENFPERVANQLNNRMRKMSIFNLFDVLT